MDRLPLPLPTLNPHQGSVLRGRVGARMVMTGKIPVYPMAVARVNGLAVGPIILWGAVGLTLLLLAHTAAAAITVTGRMPTTPLAIRMKVHV